MGITLKFTYEGGSNEPQVSEHLVAVLALTRRINSRYTKDVDITFGSMLSAFLSADDPLSRWFRERAEQSGAVEKILGLCGITRTSLVALGSVPVSALPEGATLQLSDSARELQQATTKLLKVYKLGYPVADVRHYIGAYIFFNVCEGKLEEVGFDRAELAEAFLDKMAQLQPKEREAWVSVHRDSLEGSPRPRLRATF